MIWDKSIGVNFYRDKPVRQGLRLRFDNSVDPEVKRACMEFCKWIRQKYQFPIRVMVYIKAQDHIKSMDGEFVSATFFGPFDKLDEPYCRVSTGDYPDMVEKRGKDNALAAILHSIAHELTHYFLWINHDIPLCIQSEERIASYDATLILHKYAETREHP